MDEQYERPPVTPTIHYGRWTMPDRMGQIARMKTLPRKGETLAQVALDPERAKWPSR